jgi:hypothetical protein
MCGQERCSLPMAAGTGLRSTNCASNRRVGCKSGCFVFVNCTIPYACRSNHSKSSKCILYHIGSSLYTRHTSYSSAGKRVVKSVTSKEIDRAALESNYICICYVMVPDRKELIKIISTRYLLISLITRKLSIMIISR